MAKKFIYFIQEGAGNAIKIGKTSNMKSRLAGLQSSNPNKLVVLFRTKETTHINEQLIHSFFANDRLIGEWFKPSPRLLKFISVLRNNVTNGEIPISVISQIIDEKYHNIRTVNLSVCEPTKDKSTTSLSEYKIEIGTIKKEMLGIKKTCVDENRYPYGYEIILTNKHIDRLDNIEKTIEGAFGK